MDKHCRYHRRSIRLKGYDYSQPGAYFITITTWQGEWLFGEILENEMRLNPNGDLVAKILHSLQNYFPVQIDPWIVMPNHVHAIIHLEDSGTGEASAVKTDLNHSRRADASPSANGTIPGTLGTIVQNYKSVTARQINRLRGTPGQPVWHRNYFERIIRNDKELRLIQAYIEENPRNWLKDPEKLRNW